MATISKAKQEIAAAEKAGNAAHKRPDPQPSTVIKDLEQQLAEARRKNLQLEKRLANAKNGPEFIIESPVLHDPAAWAELNNGKNAKSLRAFQLPSYLQVHAQPLVEDATGRVKQIEGGSVELIRGRGEFENPDWAKYLSLNFPDYIISRRQADGTYKRYVAEVPAPALPERRSGEFYYDELPQTPRTLAASNPNAQVINPYMPVVTAATAPAPAPAPVPTRVQSTMPQELKERLAARAEETNAPVAVLAGS